MAETETTAQTPSSKIQAWLALLPMVINLISMAAQMMPTAGAVPRYLTLLANLVGQGVQAYDQLTTLRDLVMTMVQEKREPTDDEWSAWEVRANLAHSQIQGYDIDAEQPL